MQTALLARLRGLTLTRCEVQRKREEQQERKRRKQEELAARRQQDQERQRLYDST